MKRKETVVRKSSMTRIKLTKTDEQIFEDDVHCRIADCRRRLRSRRSTLRAQNHPPNQRSSQRLSQKLDEASPYQVTEQLEEREEALIT
jgi:hypothetical protein